MNGKGLLSKTILVAMLFTISVISQIAVSSIEKKNSPTWKFLASIDFIGNYYR